MDWNITILQWACQSCQTLFFKVSYLKCSICKWTYWWIHVILREYTIVIWYKTRSIMTWDFFWGINKAFNPNIILTATKYGENVIIISTKCTDNLRRVNGLRRRGIIEKYFTLTWKYLLEMWNWIRVRRLSMIMN